MDSVNKLINKQKQNIIDEFVDGLIGEGKTIITLKELKEFYDTIEKQKKQIKRLREKNKLLREENSRLFLDQDITNTLYNEASSEYNSLKYDYKILKNKEKQVIEFIDITPEVKPTERAKVKNERGAGRKAKFTELEIETMKMYKMQGMSTRGIAEIFKCSHTTVNKLIK